MNIPTIQQLQEAVAIKEEIAQLEAQLRRVLKITEDDIDVDFMRRARRSGGKMIPLRDVKPVKTAPAAKTPRPSYLKKINNLLY